MIKHPQKKPRHIPISRIKHILVLNPSVTFSSSAIYLCAQNNVPIDFLDYTGKPFARMAAPEQPAWRYGTYQLEALRNLKGWMLARTFVEAKIRNQFHLLKYHAKYRLDRDPRFAELYHQEVPRIEGYLEELEALPLDMDLTEGRGKLFGIEGRAAGAYWKLVRQIVRKRIDFEGRRHRGAEDLMNVLLNYGYGILYSRIWGALMLAGLNVQISFLHAPQYQKPTLVFDMIEEFRAQVIDRVVISMLNRGEKFHLHKGRLNKESRDLIVENVFERLNTPVKFAGKHRPLQEIIHHQARQIGRFLKGEIPLYKPFIARW